MLQTFGILETSVLFNYVQHYYTGTKQMSYITEQRRKDDCLCGQYCEREGTEQELKIARATKKLQVRSVYIYM